MKLPKRYDDEWIDNKHAKLVSRIKEQQDHILNLELKRASNEKYEAALTFICRMILRAPRMRLQNLSIR